MEEHIHDENCQHGHEEDSEAEFTSEEMAVAANDKVDVLLDLLVKKGVINEAEFNTALDKFYDELEDEDGEEAPEAESMSQEAPASVPNNNPSENQSNNF